MFFSMDEIEKDLQVLPALVTSLEDLREETSRHSQLATAQENLKHLFTGLRSSKLQL
jgi:hypothetical protein